MSLDDGNLVTAPHLVTAPRRVLPLPQPVSRCRLTIPMVVSGFLGYAKTPRWESAYEPPEKTTSPKTDAFLNAADQEDQRTLRHPVIMMTGTGLVCSTGFQNFLEAPRMRAAISTPRNFAYADWAYRSRRRWKNIPPSESSLDERNYEEFYKQKISHTPVKTLEKLSTGEDQDLYMLTSATRVDKALYERRGVILKMLIVVLGDYQRALDDPNRVEVYVPTNSVVYHPQYGTPPASNEWNPNSLIRYNLAILPMSMFPDILPMNAAIAPLDVESGISTVEDQAGVIPDWTFVDYGTYSDIYLEQSEFIGLAACPRILNNSFAGLDPLDAGYCFKKDNVKDCSDTGDAGSPVIMETRQNGTMIRALVGIHQGIQCSNDSTSATEYSSSMSYSAHASFICGYSPQCIIRDPTCNDGTLKCFLQNVLSGMRIKPDASAQLERGKQKGDRANDRKPDSVSRTRNVIVCFGAASCYAGIATFFVFKAGFHVKIKSTKRSTARYNNDDDVRRTWRTAPSTTKRNIQEPVKTDKKMGSFTLVAVTSILLLVLGGHLEACSNVAGTLVCEDVCDVKKPGRFGHAVDFQGTRLDLDCVRYKGLKVVKLFTKTYCKGKTQGMEKVVQPWELCFFKHEKKPVQVQELEENLSLTKEEDKEMIQPTKQTQWEPTRTMAPEVMITTTAVTTKEPLTSKTPTLTQATTTSGPVMTTSLEPTTAKVTTVLAASSAVPAPSWSPIPAVVDPLGTWVPMPSSPMPSTEGSQNLSSILDDLGQFDGFNLTARRPDGTLVQAEFSPLSFWLDILTWVGSALGVGSSLIAGIVCCCRNIKCKVRSKQLDAAEVFARLGWPLLRAWMLRRIRSSRARTIPRNPTPMPAVDTISMDSFHT
ncbi:unnamed protein product, partial [Notodromas monacha]